jgi:hypothetical protein
MLELKGPFAFCGVRICPAGFCLMCYFLGVELMPTGPTPAVIPRGKTSTNWGLTPSVMILNVTGHLPREHPHVADTTHDDGAEEGFFKNTGRDKATSAREKATSTLVNASNGR